MHLYYVKLSNVSSSDTSKNTILVNLPGSSKHRASTTCNRFSNSEIIANKTHRIVMASFILFYTTLSVLLHTSYAFTTSTAPSALQSRFTSKRIAHYKSNSSRRMQQIYNNPEEEVDEEEEEKSPPIIDGFDLDDNDLNDVFTKESLASMTVPQLKQQLRLRGKKTSGNKSELITRLLDNRFFDISNEDEASSTTSINETSSTTASSSRSKVPNEKYAKRIADAKSRGADIVDVTDYVEAEEVGKSFRSSNKDNIIDVETEEEKTEESSPEVWGEDARIVEDYEGRSVVVDGLSRTVIEYKGCNNTVVQAYVVGSRDALTKFLRGGQQDKNSTTTAKKYKSLEEEVYDIQRKREVENMRTLPKDDLLEGEDDEDFPLEPIARDPGDWGVWTPTGAQLSASEVQGVLLLSDVYGAFSDNTQALADKIAFECQPVVVMVPDMFRGKPWTDNPVVGEDGIERNEQRQSYEEWRASHPERRVDVDIRAAAAVLRERYAVSSIAVWGTCYGGGRALEAASGWYKGGIESYYHDAFSERSPPPHVDPCACIAWYPTRYEAKKLFGKDHEGFRTFENGDDRTVAVMAVFAEEDTLPGATKEDAALLKECLDNDPRVKDAMVKIFPNQHHGFAHNIPKQYTEGFDEDRFVVEDGYGGRASLADHEYSGDAEVACLLSTAWMETYTRVFLPTVGSPIRDDEDDEWSKKLDINEFKDTKRDIRQEIEDAISTFEPPEVDYSEVEDSRNSDFLDSSPEDLRRLELEQEKKRQKLLERLEEYNIDPDDDDEIFSEKLLHAFPDILEFFGDDTAREG